MWLFSSNNNSDIKDNSRISFVMELLKGLRYVAVVKAVTGEDKSKLMAKEVDDKSLHKYSIMTTRELERKFNYLHPALARVYEQEQAYSKDIVALYENSKAFLKAIVQAHEADPETEPETTVEQQLCEKQNQELADLLKSFNQFLEDFAAFMNEALAVKDAIKVAMEGVMTLGRNLDSPHVPAEDSAALLLKLEPAAKDAVNKSGKVKERLTKFRDEYKRLQTQYAQWAAEKNVLHDLDVVTAKNLGATQQQWDDIHFYLVTFRKWHDEAKRALKQLLFKQFPEFKAHTHRAITDYINSINSQIAEKVAFHCRVLLDEQAGGVVPAEKYDEKQLQKWRAFYFADEGNELLTDSERNKYYSHRIMSDEEWEQFKKTENEKTTIYNNFFAKRKKEWYDAMQPLNFKHLPELSDLDGDYWLLYAVNMRDDYENWKTWSESLHTFLSYDLDPELLNGDAKIWRDKMTEIYCSWSGERQQAHLAEWERKWMEG